MTTAEILEGTMFICFSISWYWSITKMLKTKIASGKSLNFIVMVCTGYLFGIGSNLIAWQAGNEFSLLIWVYCWNLLVVGVDAMLVVRYSERRLAPRTTALGPVADRVLF